jgi:beta-catenin-like protein 1
LICVPRFTRLTWHISREKLLARTRAIKVLDYAMQTEDGSDSCERFVDVLGLKTFFSAFMGKVSHTISS